MKQMIRVLFLVTVALVVQDRNCDGVVAQESDFPAALLGQWAGEGRSMGMHSRPKMTWERVLGEKFIRLHFRNEIKNAQGKTEIFEGHAYYKSIGAGKFIGSWFDSGGATHPIVAVFENMTLDATWGTEQTQLGRTHYRIVAPDLVEIIDTVRRPDGTWREFSRTMLKRQ